MNWERSPWADDWPGCYECANYAKGRCTAFPERIPFAIFSGQVDHLVPRPGQVGVTVFEQMDVEHWLATGERVPLRRDAAALDGARTPVAPQT